MHGAKALVWQTVASCFQAAGALIGIGIAIYVPRQIAKQERDDRIKRERLRWRHFGIALQPVLDEIRTSLIERQKEVRAGRPNYVTLSDKAAQSLESDLNHRDDIGYNVQDLNIGIIRHNNIVLRLQSTIPTFMSNEERDAGCTLDEQRLLISEDGNVIAQLIRTLEELDVKVGGMMQSRNDQL